MSTALCTREASPPEYTLLQLQYNVCNNNGHRLNILI